MKDSTTRWIALACLFLGGCALIAALSGSSVTFLLRYLKVTLGVGVGIAALTGTVAVVNQLRREDAQWSLVVGYLLALLIFMPIAISVALRVL